MTYSQVSNRLRLIKHQIQELRQLPLVEIQDKIFVLKKINTLLKVQNQLLVIRQGFLNEGFTKRKGLYTSHIKESKVA
jgi:metal-dependent HD superfamily phosphatase/phosphodiesterase